MPPRLFASPCLLTSSPCILNSCWITCQFFSLSQILPPRTQSSAASQPNLAREDLSGKLAEWRRRAKRLEQKSRERDTDLQRATTSSQDKEKDPEKTRDKLQEVKRKGVESESAASQAKAAKKLAENQAAKEAKEKAGAMTKAAEAKEMTGAAEEACSAAQSVEKTASAHRASRGVPSVETVQHEASGSAEKPQPKDLSAETLAAIAAKLELQKKQQSPMTQLSSVFGQQQQQRAAAAAVVFAFGTDLFIAWAATTAAAAAAAILFGFGTTPWAAANAAAAAQPSGSSLPEILHGQQEQQQMSTSDVNGLAQVLAVLGQHLPAAVSGSSNFLSPVSGWHGQEQQQSSFLDVLGLSKVQNAQLLLQQRLSHMMPHTFLK